MSDESILFVDDDPDDIDVALRAIRRELPELSVSVARDGKEALEMLGIEPQGDGPRRLQPSVIFLDLKMPRVDGWEVLRRIREDDATHNLPVVILSWSAQRHDVERCYALGANSFMVKRFDPVRPGAYLARAADYWVRLNEAPPPPQH